MINDNQTTIRASAALTHGYVTAAYSDPINDASQLYLYATYTKGDEDSCTIKVEFSPDGTLWGQETFGAITGGTDTASLGVHTMSATGVYTFQIPVMGYKVRVSAIATNGTPTGTLKLDLQEGNA